MQHCDVTGQIIGTFSIQQKPLEPLGITNFKQIGFEALDDNMVLVINGVSVKIGVTDRIEYQNVQITSCELETEGALIITYMYEKESK